MSRALKYILFLGSTALLMFFVTDLSSKTVTKKYVDGETKRVMKQIEEMRSELKKLGY